MRRRIPTGVAALLTLTMAAPASGAFAGRDIDCARVRCIALTFDDGPGRYTGRLLDILRDHRTRVTFFLTGRHVEKNAGTVRRMARDGHQIGGHTFTHPHLTSLPDDRIRAELSRTQQAIERVTGRRPDIMRPPYGDTGDRVGAIAAELGLSQILWNRSPHDWELRNADALTKKTLDLAERDRVVLLHDIWPHTVHAMPAILSSLEKRGYHVVTVERLLRGRRLSPGEVYPVGGWN